MSSSYVVRPAEQKDFSQWLPLWESYNAFYGRSGKTALPEKITSTTWERFFDNEEPVHALVSEGGGKIVGFTHYLFHRSTTMIDRTCYLQDLYTIEALRGKGIGNALIKAVYEEAKSVGSTKVYWQTHETNHLAMKLYDKVAERSGFLVYQKKV